MDKKYLNTREAAAFTGMSYAWLCKRRMKRLQHEGPRFLKIGKRIVYDVLDLIEWLTKHRSP